METTAVKLKIVWAVTERGSRTQRTRIGVAWEARDGTLSARLDAVPIGGLIEVRDWVDGGEGPARALAVARSAQGRERAP